MKILLVDDSSVNLGVVVESLESYGYDVLVALDGEEALQRVEVARPDLILLDVMMPGMTGFEVTQALKAAANRYLGYTEEPLVSIDFQGNPQSSVIDAMSTKVIGSMVKVLAWYDNEWGYSNRVLDLIMHMEANKPL